VNHIGGVNGKMLETKKTCLLKPLKPPWIQKKDYMHAVLVVYCHDNAEKRPQNLSDI
jgi:hypothetical protein